jgi:ribosomal protein S24E
MDIEIVNERKNPYLSRVEVHFIVKYPGGATPKRELVQGAIADMLGVKKEFVVIDGLKTMFGIEAAKGYAKIYSSKETCMRTEREQILVRNKLKEKKVKKKEAAPAAAKPAEAKKEEKPAAKKEEKPAVKKEEKPPEKK